MRQTKNITGNCQNCGRQMEFPADSIGLVAKCPYCRRETELTLAVPQAPPTIPRKAVVWSIIAVLILGLGLWGSLTALNRAERWSAQMKETTGVTNGTPDRR